MIRRITPHEVNAIYVEQVKAGTLRDWGLLEGAVMAPFQDVFGFEVYPTLIQKAGKLLDSVQRVQAFTDGNKRLAWLSTVVFLQQNGQVVIDLAAEEIDDFIRQLSAFDDPEVRAAQWLNDRCVGLS